MNIRRILFAIPTFLLISGCSKSDESSPQGSAPNQQKTDATSSAEHLQWLPLKFPETKVEEDSAGNTPPSEIIDRGKSLKIIAAEAKAMNTTELGKKIAQYSPIVSDEMDTMNVLHARLMELPKNELMGEKGRKLNAQLDKVGKRLSIYQSQASLYISELTGR